MKDSKKGLNLEQKGAILVAILLFCTVYFGFDIVPSEQKELEKSRSLATEATSVQNLIIEAQEELGSKYGILEAITMELNGIEDDSLKTESLKLLSGRWYDLGYPAISAYYAEEIAKIDQDPLSWSIAGTTYLLGLKSSDQEKTRTWCFNRAVQAFETAISLDPENVDNRINLALGYIDMPPADNPMKGILMLRELDNKYPGNVKVLAQLGRLSLETNQIDNAIKRLKQGEEIQPDNNRIICLLAQAYEKAGNLSEADKYNKKCIDN